MSAEAVAVEAQVTLIGVGAARTDVGRRREHNEDQVLLCPDLGLFVVADGMGGHDAGDVASAIVVASMQEYFWADAPLLGTPDKDELAPGARRLVQAVHYANHEVYATSGRSAQQGGMGSTVVGVYVEQAQQLIHICHVGDSRCYRMRDNELVQLTADHSMINEALRLNPNLSPEILKQLPTNVVTRALGTKELVKPDVSSEPLRAGDIYMLCSDGLNGEVSDEDIAFALADGESLDGICELLINMANDSGGRDNVSVLLVQILEQPVSELEAAATDAGGVAWSEPAPSGPATEEDPEAVEVEVDIDLDGMALDGGDTVPEVPLAAALKAVRASASGDDARRRRAERARRIAHATARLDAALDELAAFEEWDAPDEAPSANPTAGPARPSAGGRLLIVPESDPPPDSGRVLAHDKALSHDDGASAEPIPLPLTNAIPPPRRAPSLDEVQPSQPLPLIEPRGPAALADAPTPTAVPAPPGPVIEGDPIMELGPSADLVPPPASSGHGSQRCIACGHKVGARERFCGMCGRPCDASTEETCLRCNKPLLEDTRYCVWCGIRHGRDWE